MKNPVTTKNRTSSQILIELLMLNVANISTVIENQG